jgi:hypothetical protein
MFPNQQFDGVCFADQQSDIVNFPDQLFFSLEKFFFPAYNLIVLMSNKHFITTPQANSDTFKMALQRNINQFTYLTNATCLSFSN